MRQHHKVNTMGRFVQMKIQSSPQILKEIELQLKVDEEVVRFRSFQLKPFAPTGLKIQSSDTKSSSTDFINQNSQFDYQAARTLVERGLVSADEIKALPRWFVSTSKAGTGT